MTLIDWYIKFKNVKMGEYQTPGRSDSASKDVLSSE